MDDYNVFFHVVFLLVAALTILTSLDFLSRERMNHAEYYALLLFATAGMLMMFGSIELMMIFIGLEVLSIATYVLAGFRRTDLKSNESALKYFLLGSFSSAFFLYGVALIFGATGSTNLIGIAEAIRSADIQISLVYLAAALMLIALCFKVAVAPFHIWTPDVYEGAPTPITGFMSVGPKAAGFAVLLRVFMTAFPAIQDRWLTIIWMIAALTMILGNVGIAVMQTSIKRMLAYSSIAHAGYIARHMAAKPKFNREEVDIRLRPNRQPERSQPLVPWWMRIERRMSALRRQPMNRRGGWMRVQFRTYQRRSVVRVTYTRNGKPKPGAWVAHTRYLIREGAQSEHQKGVGFDLERGDIDVVARVRDWEKAGDERLWRIIVSPEDADRIDLKEHIRELATAMERDLGTRLEMGRHRPP